MSTMTAWNVTLTDGTKMTIITAGGLAEIERICMDKGWALASARPQNNPAPHDD